MMKKIAVLLLLICSTANANSNATDMKFSDRNEVKLFIADVSKEHSLDIEELTNLFSKIHSNPEIIQRITTPFEKVEWNKYRKHFINPKRINGGVSFLKKYNKDLIRAEKEYGVPKEIISAIIGVESNYGITPGKYGVLETLSTLSFDYPPRAKFFRGELVEFLLLTKEKHLDPLELRGSYAGAMGIPQFISSCYRKYAIDFGNAGKVDLINNMTTAIGSVANYFVLHGWKPNQPVMHEASVSGNKYKKLKPTEDANPKPNHTVGELAKFAVSPKDNTLAGDTKVALVSLDTNGELKHWLIRDNFYTITRYNHSTLYAMAVYELSKELAKKEK